MKKTIISLLFICISFFYSYAESICIDILHYLDNDQKQLGFTLYYDTDSSKLFIVTVNSGSFYSFDFTLDYADTLRKGIEKYKYWKFLAKENSTSVNKELPNSADFVQLYWRARDKVDRYSFTFVYLEADINPESSSLSWVIQEAQYNTVDNLVFDTYYLTFPDEDEVQRFYNDLSPDYIDSKIMEYYSNKQTTDDLFQ